MPKKLNMDAVLEEYRQLSAEVRNYFDRQSFTINFAVFITLGTVGIGTEFKIWELFLITASLTAFLWLKEIMRAKAVWRASAYIQVFIESRIPELKWQTAGKNHPDRYHLFRILSNAMLPILFCFNLTLAWQHKKEMTFFPMWFRDTLLIVCVIMLVALSILSIYEFLRGRRNEVRVYEKQKNENLKHKT
jgi:hypothetical protein